MPRGLLLDKAHNEWIADRRIGIRHAADRCEAARGRRVQSGLDRLFVFLPRLAEMHMHVAKSRHDDGSLQIANLAIGSQAAANALDDTVSNLDVNIRLIEILRRIDEPSVLKKKIHRR